MKVIAGPHTGKEYIKEDTWYNVAGYPWTQGRFWNPACAKFLAENGLIVLKWNNDDIYYGKIDGMGVLMHKSQLGE